MRAFFMITHETNSLNRGLYDTWVLLYKMSQINFISFLKLSVSQKLLNKFNTQRIRWHLAFISFNCIDDRKHK